MDQPGPGAPAGERHLERVDDERRAHVGGHRPADDLARVSVLHGGEMQPPFAGPQVGDVRDPQHVRSVGSEVALDEVRGGLDAGHADRRPPPLTRLDPRDTGGFHQAGDALAPDPDPVLEAQLGMDPGRAVNTSARVVDLLDLLGQPSIGQGAIGRWPALPIVEAGAVDAEHAAHHGDGIVGLLRGDERERLAYRPSLSFAKKTAAFARISRSIRSFAFSSRSLCSSSRSSLLRPPGRSPRSARSCLIQLRNVTSEIPRSLASWRCGLSPNKASLIASRRNSSGYGGPVLGTRTSLPPAYNRKRSSVLQNGATPRKAAASVATTRKEQPRSTGYRRGKR